MYNLFILKTMIISSYNLYYYNKKNMPKRAQLVFNLLNNLYPFFSRPKLIFSNLHCSIISDS